MYRTSHGKSLNNAFIFGDRVELEMAREEWQRRCDLIVRLKLAKFARKKLPEDF
jgi:hypothetical protein